jgi:hypothetical protein
VVVGAFVVVVVGATVVVVVAGAFVVVVVPGAAVVVLVPGAAVVVVIAGAAVVVVVAAAVVDVDGACSVVVVVRCGRGGRGTETVGNVIVGRVCGVWSSVPLSSPPPLLPPPSSPTSDVAVVGRAPVGRATAVVAPARLAVLTGLVTAVLAVVGPVALGADVAWNPWRWVTATAGLADSRIPVAEARRRLVFCMSTSLQTACYLLAIWLPTFV